MFHVTALGTKLWPGIGSGVTVQGDQKDSVYVLHSSMQLEQQVQNQCQPQELLVLDRVPRAYTQKFVPVPCHWPDIFLLTRHLYHVS